MALSNSFSHPKISLRSIVIDQSLSQRLCSSFEASLLLIRFTDLTEHCVSDFWGRETDLAHIFSCDKAVKLRRSSSVTRSMIVLISPHILTMAMKSDLFLITDCGDVVNGSQASMVNRWSTYLSNGEDVCYGSEDAFRQVNWNEVFSSVNCCYSRA